MEPIDFSRYKAYFSGCRHGRHGHPKEDIPPKERIPWDDIYGPDDFNQKTEKKLEPYLDEMSKCYACRDRFQWPLVLKACPDLFANLTYIRLTYEGHTKDQFRGSRMGRKHFPYVLQLMPRLQILALECWRDVEEKYPDGVMSWYECARKECVRFARAILGNASKELRVLELNGIIELIPQIDHFLAYLEELPKLRTVKLALYHDLKRRAALTWLTKGRNDSVPGESDVEYLDYGSGIDHTLEYIIGIRRAIARGWEVRPINLSEGYMLTKPWRFFNLLRPRNIEHLRWLLRSNLDWNPVWKWKSYMYRELTRQWWRPRRHDPDIETDTPHLRQLFTEIRAAGKPVRLRIATPGPKDSFFAWQARREVRVAGAGNYVVLPWRLDLIGDLVDEIQLCRGSYRMDYEWNRTVPDAVTPEQASEHVQEYLKRTKGPLEQQLEFETERIAPFFARLRVWCPYLKKLALYMPNCLYPDSDRLFVERVLPGEAGAWTVKQRGGRPDYDGYTKDLVNHEEEGMVHDSDDDPSAVDREMNMRRKISNNQILDMMEKVQEERCPMVERVFDRRTDEEGRLLKGLPSIDEEWNLTKRGLGGLKCFDVTRMREARRKFEYLWPN